MTLCPILINNSSTIQTRTDLKWVAARTREATDLVLILASHLPEPKRLVAFRECSQKKARKKTTDASRDEDVDGSDSTIHILNPVPVRPK